mmetsp:Transcript_31805/g.45215  ORF Transcript_31805/g.45215 Transcript_31805/m.45215 type:complete len:374 (+) Transcript_31805:593-1714(+)
MFVVKNPDLFASKIIPQYFDHNKFSSFARQLNFYGFRKMQAKPIRNADFDVDSAKHVTFYNEKFKRGRCDLLKEIQRSTRGGGSQANQEQMRQIEDLKKQVAVLEDKLKETNDNMEERIRRLELEMLGRMEQMMLAMQQTQMQSSGSGSNGNNNNNNNNNSSNNGISSSMRKPNNNEMAPTQQRGPDHPSWDPLPLDRNRSVSSFTIDTGINSNNKTDVGGPTLPPHPKQKNLPINGLPKALALPPSRLNSLRGISNISMSRGVSTGITRNMSESSTASALLNNWENGFFTMLMTGESEAQQASGQTPQQQRQQQQQNDYSAGQHSINDAALTAAAVQMQNLAMSQQQQIPAQKQQRDGMNPQFNNSGNTTAI